jgi:hypothetical protein
MNGNCQTRFSGSSHMTELQQHIVSEKKTQYGGTRFVVRVVQFEDNKVRYVAISKQWYKFATNEWLPSQRGHIFLPIDVWTTLAETCDAINQEFAPFLSNEYSGCGRDTERANEPDASERPVQHDSNFCRRAEFEFDSDDIVTGRNATKTVADPHRGVDTDCEAQTKATYSSVVTRTANTGGPSSTKRSMFEH